MTLCDVLHVRTQSKEEEVDQKRERYMVRPPRDLTSQFDRRMEEKQQAKIKAEERKRREEEEARIAVRGRVHVRQRYDLLD